MHVEWLKTALKNLDEQAAWIARCDPRAAVDFIDMVQRSVAQLALFPGMGRSGRIKGTREWAISGYPCLIPYRVVGNRLQILRIFHTRQLPPSNW